MIGRVRDLVFLSVAAALAFSCGQPESGPRPIQTAGGPPSPTATLVATVSPSATTTTSPAVIIIPSPSVQSAPTPKPPVRALIPSLEVLLKGLQTPWAIDFSPDGRIFLTERPGRIRVVSNGILRPEPWATLDVAETGESGLMGLALDPQFAQNRFIYVAYTFRGPGGRLINRLARLREDPGTGKGILDKVLLDGIPGGTNHDGGRVKFGPDGKLYWTMGETFNRSLAQDLSSLNGKILRLEPDGAIPKDNPFPNSYIYSYGNRNPQGLAWQPGTARLYETEHGPSGEKGCCQDEVNLIDPGKNYGWPVISGNETREGMVSPVLQSGDSVTWAPGGATFVTRGPWAGSLLFTGLRGQALYRLTLDPNDPRKAQSFETLFEGQYGRLRDVSEGPDGTLYILTSNRDGRGSPGPDDDRVLRLKFR